MVPVFKRVYQTETVRGVALVADGKAKGYTVTHRHGTRVLQWVPEDEPHKLYVTILDDNGKACDCSCPAWRVCRHMRASEAMVKHKWFRIGERNAQEEAVNAEETAKGPG